MTQAALAVAVGVQPKTIHNLESGTTGNLKMMHRGKLATVLDIPIAALMAAEAGEPGAQLILWLPQALADGLRRLAGELGTESLEAAALDVLTRAIEPQRDATGRIARRYTRTDKSPGRMTSKRDVVPAPKPIHHH